MKFCPYCGNQMEDEMKFCSQCGKEFKVTIQDQDTSSNENNNIKAENNLNNDGLDALKDMKDSAASFGKAAAKGLFVAAVAAGKGAKKLKDKIDEEHGDEIRETFGEIKDGFTSLGGSVLNSINEATSEEGKAKREAKKQAKKEEQKKSTRKALIGFAILIGLLLLMNVINGSKKSSDKDSKTDSTTTVSAEVTSTDEPTATPKATETPEPTATSSEILTADNNSDLAELLAFDFSQEYSVLRNFASTYKGRTIDITCLVLEIIPCDDSGVQYTYLLSADNTNSFNDQVGLFWLDSMAPSQFHWKSGARPDSLKVGSKIQLTAKVVKYEDGFIYLNPTSTAWIDDLGPSSDSSQINETKNQISNEEIRDTIDGILADSFGENTYEIYEENDTLNITFIVDDAATKATLAKAGDKDSLKEWNSLMETLQGLSELTNDFIVDTLKRTDFPTIIYLLNDLDPSNTLAVFSYDMTLYDYVNDINLLG